MNGMFLINLLTNFIYFIYFLLTEHIVKYLIAQSFYVINILIIRACLLPRKLFIFSEG